MRLPKEEHTMIGKLGLAAALAGALMLALPGGATAASLSAGRHGREVEARPKP